MIIKKHPNKNEYLLTPDKLWVRNLCNKKCTARDVNSWDNDYSLFVENELENFKRRLPGISSESFPCEKVVIVSDGFDFARKQEILSSLPPEVTIVGVNKSLLKWKIGDKRPMRFYVVNNPYPEAGGFLPKKKPFPKCIASMRTSTKFTENYRGDLYLYSPTPDADYGGTDFGHAYTIDDYHNPICAAIGLSYRFGAEQILLFCCDDAFVDERPGAEQLENKLWQYPQQFLSQRIIDANMYWLKQSGIKTGNHSSGIKLDHASYISEDGIKDFFNDDQQTIAG